MKAVVCSKYGGPDVLQTKVLDKPIPKDDEVLVKIFATSETAAHCSIRKGIPLVGRLLIGLTKPKRPIPGTDLAGEVEAIGKDVTQFKAGNGALQ
ncbi:MAG: hypothetical protein WKF97_14890 [Chitinophagaceae bacterium]